MQIAVNLTRETHSKKAHPSTAAWRLDELQNVGHCLSETASRMPDAIAVIAYRNSKSARLEYDQITFSELESASNRIAKGLVDEGVRPGMRIALMVPPGIDFVAHVFALFKTGAVIILIDPGMGRQNMIRCLSDARPQGVVGIRLAQFARLLFRHKFPESKRNFVVGSNWFPGCSSTLKFQQQISDRFDPILVRRQDPAAIIFTTGSTGPPKGVLYRHQIFIEQSQQIRDFFQIQPGTVDVSGFPLFALFNTAMGTTTIFPKMDATRPADVHPPDIIDAIERFNADQSFGSPALWNTVSLYCERESVKLPTVKRVLSAGAPVPPLVLQRIKKIISTDGDAFTPYGATEALPVACNSATVVLKETAPKTNQGAGTCVGHRFQGIQWRVIKISDEPIPDISLAEDVPPSQIGELIVQGVVVTDQYVTRTDANADHKIKDGDRLWHRMGDVGYLDDQDRFWFCGRKSHRVQTASGTMFTIPCEAIVNTHPKVYRSALVGTGKAPNQVPAMVVEPDPDAWTDARQEQSLLLDDIFELMQNHSQTNSIERTRILLHRKLPTDIRHNSKIFREQLREWVAQRTS